VVDPQAGSRAIGFASTDMLHRRIALPYRFQVELERLKVLVMTDSLLMEQAFSGCVRSSCLMAEGDAAVWEIAVEAQNETDCPAGEELADDFDVYSFGPSRSLRMSSGSWFAYTPPSLSGVGFAIVVGDECCRVRQLREFVERIRLFAGECETQGNVQVEHEVLA
jgi:hypothetical protein